jgi:hypothetical protein
MFLEDTRSEFWYIEHLATEKFPAATVQLISVAFTEVNGDTLTFVTVGGSEKE